MQSKFIPKLLVHNLVHLGPDPSSNSTADPHNIREASYIDLHRLGTINFDPCVADFPLCSKYHAVRSLCSGSPLCCGSIPVLQIFSFHPYVMGTIHFDTCVADLPLCWGFHAVWSLYCRSPLCCGSFLFTPMLWVLYILIPELRISAYDYPPHTMLKRSN